MDAKDFEQYAKSGAIKRVALRRMAITPGWQAYAYGDYLPTDIANVIDLSLGILLPFRSLDDAHRYIRKAGFRHVIEIDAPKEVPSGGESHAQ